MLFVATELLGGQCHFATHFSEKHSVSCVTPCLLLMYLI